MVLPNIIKNTDFSKYTNEVGRIYDCFIIIYGSEKDAEEAQVK